jgi:cobyrinic acid a,c-diamide synthase
MSRARIIVSALRGGAGKTVISLGIAAALRRRGLSVAPFKKGPDYIDAGWLALAAGRPCYNLDTFLVNEADVLNSFLRHTRNADIAVIEGNRGLFDGIDPEGTTSTAELAKLLQAPVILCLDCTKTTRTMAAVVNGCRGFDPAIAIRGVILNRVAGARHQKILTTSIQQHCGIPVVGAVPKLRRQSFPERHMGLVPTPEHDWADASIDAAAEMVAEHIDLDRILDFAHEAADLTETPPAVSPDPSASPPPPASTGQQPRVGIFRDSAFQFYYPDNIEALVRAGAEVVFLSPLADAPLPALDALYIGGGFPETHAAELAAGRRVRRQLRALADDGFPIYAECGGLMYLGQALVLDGQSFPMAGILPVSYGFSKRPQGHGYTIVDVVAENPYFPVGTRLQGHEFHYSNVRQWDDGRGAELVFKMARGAGFRHGMDGVCYRKVLATYTHLHALGTPQWAQALVHRAREYRACRHERRQHAC